MESKNPEIIVPLSKLRELLDDMRNAKPKVLPFFEREKSRYFRYAVLAESQRSYRKWLQTGIIIGILICAIVLFAYFVF